MFHTHSQQHNSEEIPPIVLIVFLVASTKDKFAAALTNKTLAATTSLCSRYGFNKQWGKGRAQVKNENSDRKSKHSLNGLFISVYSIVAHAQVLETEAVPSTVNNQSNSGRCLCREGVDDRELIGRRHKSIVVDGGGTFARGGNPK